MDDLSALESQSFNLVVEGLDPKGDAEGQEDIVDPANALDVVTSHDQSFSNYLWLHPYYGIVLWIDFEEPAGSEKWLTYDRYYWCRHSDVVNHHPDVLYEEHVREFINPETKSINLLFWFQRPDGSVYSMAPTEHFYELEAEYFKRWKLCDPDAPLPKHKEKSGPEPLYCQNVKSSKRK